MGPGAPDCLPIGAGDRPALRSSSHASSDTQQETLPPPIQPAGGAAAAMVGDADIKHQADAASPADDRPAQDQQGGQQAAAAQEPGQWQPIGTPGQVTGTPGRRLTLRIGAAPKSPAMAGYQQQHQQQQGDGGAAGAEPLQPRAPRHAGPLYGGEVVGRRCSLLRCSRASGRGSWWDAAQITGWDAGTQRHRLAFGGGADEWVSLADVKFKWRGGAPPSAAPNPSYRPDLAAAAAVGRRLRVYWPTMQRWYRGTVRGYDQKTDRHAVWYRDGDSQTLVLRHEPVVWVDAEPGPPAPPGAADAAAQGGAGTGSAAVTPTAEAAADCVAAAFAPSEPDAAGAARWRRAGSSTSSGGVGGLSGLAAEAAAALACAFAPSPPGTAQLLWRAGSGAGLGKRSWDAWGGAAAAGGARKRLCGSASGLQQPAASASAASGGQPDVGIDHSGKAELVGCRVGIYWRRDGTAYRGRLASYSPASGKFTVRYDDGQTEQLLLERETLTWHTPRGATAGYNTERHAAMAALGAARVAAAPVPAPPQGDRGGLAAEAPAGADAVGWRLRLWFGADGSWHEAQVLSYSAARRRHHLLFLDGEHEWADLAREAVAWLAPPEPGRRGVAAGPLRAEDVPSRRAAVGWRLSVYRPAEGAFRDAQVASYDEDTGHHSLLYTDDDEEDLTLADEVVVWRVAPREEDSEAAAVGLADAGAVAGAGSDYEPEEGSLAGGETDDDATGGAGDEDVDASDDEWRAGGLQRRRSSRGGAQKRRRGRGGGGSASRVASGIDRARAESWTGGGSVLSGGSGLTPGGAGTAAAAAAAGGGAAPYGGHAHLRVAIPGTTAGPSAPAPALGVTRRAGAAAGAALLPARPRADVRPPAELRISIRIVPGSGGAAAAAAGAAEAAAAAAAGAAADAPASSRPVSAARLARGVGGVQLVMAKLVGTATLLGWQMAAVPDEFAPAAAAAAAAAQKQQQQQLSAGQPQAPPAPPAPAPSPAGAARAQASDGGAGGSGTTPKRQRRGSLTGGGGHQPMVCGSLDSVDQPATNGIGGAAAAAQLPPSTMAATFGLPDFGAPSPAPAAAGAASGSPATSAPGGTASGGSGGGSAQPAVVQCIRRTCAVRSRPGSAGPGGPKRVGFSPPAAPLNAHGTTIPDAAVAPATNSLAAPHADPAATAAVPEAAVAASAAVAAAAPVVAPAPANQAPPQPVLPFSGPLPAFSAAPIPLPLGSPLAQPLAPGAAAPAGGRLASVHAALQQLGLLPLGGQPAAGVALPASSAELAQHLVAQLQVSAALRAAAAGPQDGGPIGTSLALPAAPALALAPLQIAPLQLGAMPGAPADAAGAAAQAAAASAAAAAAGLPPPQSPQDGAAVANLLLQQQLRLAAVQAGTAPP